MRNLMFLSDILYIRTYIKQTGGIPSKMVIVIGNGIGDPSSNP